MDPERKRVLELLAAGKITVDEAADLLDALEGGARGGNSGAAAAQGWTESQREGGHDQHEGPADHEPDFEELRERIRQAVAWALGRVEQELRDLGKRLQRDDWPPHWRMGGDWGRTSGRWHAWHSRRWSSERSEREGSL